MSKKKLRKRVKKLEKLISGAIWLHTDLRYAYEQMTTEEKKLYCEVIGEDFEEFNEEFFEARRRDDNIRDNEGRLVYGVHPDGRRVFPLDENYRRAGFVELIGAPK